MSELQIQTFLRSGKTLADLEAEYAIKAKPSTDGRLVSLNYNQIASPMHEIICQEARGLVIETGTWNVASRSFFKFFNHGEANAHPIDWATAEIVEKLDGSLVMLYHWDGAWRVATKGTPDAGGPVGGLGMTFEALVRAAVRDMGFGFEEFTALLNPDVFYSFELTTPENQVILMHEARRLTLLAAWDKATLAELDLAAVPPTDWPRAAKFEFATLEEVLAATENIDIFEMEGYVIKDASHHRVKIKSPSYLMADRVMSSITAPRRKVELALAGNFDDVVAMLPASWKDIMYDVHMRLQALLLKVLVTYQSLPHGEDRKTFALAATKTPYPGLMFSLYDGKTADEAVKATSAEKVAQWIGL